MAVTFIRGAQRRVEADADAELMLRQLRRLSNYSGGINYADGSQLLPKTLNVVPPLLLLLLS